MGGEGEGRWGARKEGEREGRDVGEKEGRSTLQFAKRNFLVKISSHTVLRSLVPRESLGTRLILTHTLLGRA